jgi:hypothetical protein
VGLRKWFVRTMSRNGLLGTIDVEQDPEEMVEAGYVRLPVSQIVVTKLKYADIPAAVIQNARAYIPGIGGESMGPMVRIMVRRADLERAVPIIDETSRGW